MAYKSNELLGAADKLIQFITDNSADLTAKGVTPAGLGTSVTNAKNDTNAKEGIQEAKKGELKTASNNYDTSANALYDLMTSVIDLCAGALGKKSAKGVQALAIRKQLNKSKKTGAGTGGTSGGG